MLEDSGGERSAGEEDVKDRITINVSGVKYETYISTLQNVADTRLAWLTENLNPNTERKEFFFDRHPGVFVHILNFYRTGKLHTPIDVCGPLFEEELQFWGIDEKQMEPCCWENFTKHREAEVNLRDFEGPGFEDLRKHRKASVVSRSRFCRARTLDNIWYILDEPHSSITAKYFSIISCMVIVISVSIYCIDSMEQINANETWQNTSYVINGMCLVWFTIEFLLRCTVCPDKREFSKSAMNWIDFTSLLPSYLLLILPSDVWLKNIVIIRLLRLFRFFKLSYGLQVLVHTLRASFYELTLLLLILLIPVVIFSSLVHTVEIALNPQTVDFRSIPETFWWCLITMTTVGYGDMVPNTWAGRMIGGVCATCGILIVALPISVIGSNFSLYYSHVRARLKLPRKKRMILSGHVRGLLKQPLSLSYRERDRRGLGKQRQKAIIKRDTKGYNSDMPSSELGHGSCKRRENGNVLGRQRRLAIFTSPPQSSDEQLSDTPDHELLFNRERDNSTITQSDETQHLLIDSLSSVPSEKDQSYELLNKSQYSDKPLINNHNKAILRNKDITERRSQSYYIDDPSNCKNNKKRLVKSMEDLTECLHYKLLQSNPKVIEPILDQNEKTEDVSVVMKFLSSPHHYNRQSSISSRASSEGDVMNTNPKKMNQLPKENYSKSHLIIPTTSTDLLESRV